jgi:hypothetical protein|tara:strand:+ start:458 stop:688 length:231 start_codon:yes stop_codon:yes gene_type:complete
MIPRSEGLRAAHEANQSISEEGRDFNERQKRYRENEWTYRYTAGADHRELMEVLRQIEHSLRALAEVAERLLKGDK